MAVEFGGWEGGDDGILDFGGGWIFLDFREHTVDEVGVVPGPVVLKRKGATNFTGFAVDVTVRVVVAHHLFLGFLESFVSSAIVLVS